MSADALSPGRSSPWLGRGLCAVTALLWSTAGLFIKDLTGGSAAGWSGWQVAGVRSLLAGMALLALGRMWPRKSSAGASGPGTPPSTTLRAAERAARAPWAPRRRQLILAAVYGPTLLTYVLAQTWTTTANAIFLQYTAPVYILLLSAWLLHEKPKTADLLTLPPLLVGIFLILSAQLRFGHGTLGNVMALISGVGYALVVLLIRKWRDEDIPTAVAMGNFLLAAVAIAVACASPQGFVWPGLRSGAEILWLGIFQIGLAYFLFQAALRRVAAVEASLITLIEPVLCPVWTWIAVADTPPRASILGGGVILVALVTHTIWKARAEGAV